MNNIVKKEINKIHDLIYQKQFNVAEKSAQVILKRDPNNSEIFDIMGDIYNAQNFQMRSLWYYFSSLDRKFNNETLYKLGTNIYYLGKYDEAEKIISSVLENDPTFISAYLTMGLIHEENEKPEDAIMCYEATIGLNPKELAAYLNLALLYKKNKNYTEAIKVYQKASISIPNNHYILSNLGNLFYMQHKYEDAIICHQRAIKIKSDSNIVYFNYANTLVNAQKSDDAVKMFNKSIELNSNFIRAHINLGTTLLAKEEFEEGFKEYEHRIHEDPYILDLIQSKKPIWKGENIEGKTIVVTCENGLGNNIQFSRYLETLSQLKCKIIFRCPEQIQHLFEDLEFIDQLISIDENIVDYDFWVPLQNLIYILTPDLKNYCPVPTTLKVNDAKMVEWETLMGVDNMVKVGLHWQGNKQNPREQQNSIELFHYKDLIENKKASFISLQKGNAQKQIEKNNFSKKIINYDPLLDTGTKKFIDTAAIIKYLDLVITTDSAIAHLAGSLGTQTWLLLPHVSDWRWFNSNDETIWYDNFRIYRQKDAGNWLDVIGKVKIDLDNLIENIHEVRNPKN